MKAARELGLDRGRDAIRRGEEMLRTKSRDISWLNQHAGPGACGAVLPA